MRKSFPLRDPIQQVIDRQMRSLAETWDLPPAQKHCHPLRGLEGEIVEALDEKEALGLYGHQAVSLFSLVRS